MRGLHLRLSPVSLYVFSLVPEVLFDCLRAPEYAKIRKSLHNNDKDLVLWARETEHPNQTVLFTKAAGRQPGWSHCYLRSSQKHGLFCSLVIHILLPLKSSAHDTCIGSSCVSGKLPTHPSPKPTSCALDFKGSKICITISVKKELNGID